ncbi:MAG: NADPH:quinone oxidoreductase family protein [Myxococcota bacterium]
MKAWQITAAGEPVDVLRCVDVERPALPPGHVRIQVDAVAVGFPDVLMCRGTYVFKPPLPFTPGQECVGRVLECASDVTQFAVGDRVMGIVSFYTGHGAYAEESIAPASSLYPADDKISDAEAAGFCIAYHTAHVALDLRAGLRAGETLLVHGASGGTGMAAIQLGKALGARVVACAGGDEKTALARELGADLVIDHRSEDFVAAVRAFTNDAGANVIYDPVGGEIYERSFDCLATHGRILPIGFACGRWGETPLGKIILANVSIVTASPPGGDYPEQLAYHAALLERASQGQLRVHVDATVDFDHVPDGVQRVSDRASMGRVVVKLR